MNIIEKKAKDVRLGERLVIRNTSGAIVGARYVKGTWEPRYETIDLGKGSFVWAKYETTLVEVVQL